MEQHNFAPGGEADGTGRSCVPSEPVVIGAPPGMGIVGAVCLIFGCALSLFCFIDMLRGNETASLFICFAFLCFGLIGLFLICYSFRRVVVNGGQILLRDMLLRTRSFRMEDIKQVKKKTAGYSFLGESGTLFRIYDYSPALEILLQRLKALGAKAELPGCRAGISLARSSHPDPEKRLFTVRRPSLFPAALTVEGRTFTLTRAFWPDRRFAVSELKRVRLTENRDRRLTIRLTLNNGRCVFKRRCFAGDLTDKSLVFALLRHLSELGVMLTGAEKTDEDVRRMLRSRLVTREGGRELCAAEYERLLPLFEEYGRLLEAFGFRLAYGLIAKEQLPAPGALIPYPLPGEAFVYGIYLGVLKDDRFVYGRKNSFPMCEHIPLLLRSDSPENLLYFSPPPVTLVKELLHVFLSLVRHKRIRISDTAAVF